MFENSLKKLNLDIIDIYLIHWPANDYNTRINLWIEMEKLLLTGKVKYIGVSNYNIDFLKEIKDLNKTLPSFHQIEINPNIKFDKNLCSNKYGIYKCFGYTPFGIPSLLNNQIIKSIAKIKLKTTASILLKWSVNQGIIPLFKTSKKERLHSNIDLNFNLTLYEMNQINSIS